MKYREDGSITIFMTFIFLLLFALTAAALDSARLYASMGYMKTSARGAELAVYGEYTRELFKEYKLFGYGGYDGKDESDWRDRYQELLYENLRERPDNAERNIFFSKKYASVYQIGNVNPEVKKAVYITDEKSFIKQLDQWIRSEGIRDIGEKLLKQIQGTDAGKKDELLDDISQTQKKEQEEKLKKEENEKQETESTIETENEVVQEKQKNPFDFLKELVENGILSLVCDVDNLAEKEIIPRKSDNNLEKKFKEKWNKGDSGIGILKQFLDQSDSMWNEEMIHDQKKKGKLLLYVSKMLGSYVSSDEERTKETVPYAREYLITGQTNPKDALWSVVNRLFFVRTMINFLYVEKDAEMQAKSLETATALAAPLMAEAFIPAIQNGILLILSLEEACVDITALLEGRCVPVFKDQSNFQIKYLEICTAGRELFLKKAKAYPKSEDKMKMRNNQLNYDQYLWLFMMMNSWKSLYERTLDIIQFDLRERYNQTFNIDQCICRTKVTVTYETPLLMGRLTGGRGGGIYRVASKDIQRKFSMTYGY